MIGVMRSHLDRHDKLLRHSLVVFFAAALSGAMNYGFQVYMINQLGSTSYGALAALFSIVYLVLYGLQSVSSVTSKLVSEYNSSGQAKKVGSVVHFMASRLFLIGAALAMLVVILRSQISGFLHIEDSSLIFFLSFILLLAFLSPVASGTLNGLQLFSWFGLSGVAGALLKLLTGSLLVNLGFGVRGALVGLGVGLLVPLLVFFVFARKLASQPSGKLDNVEVFRFVVPAMFTVGLLILISSIDIILVRHQFSAHESGVYAAMSTLAKIIWFACTPLIVVMLPKINASSGRAMLRQTLLIVGLIGILGSAAFAAFGSALSKLAYDASPQLIVVFALSMSAFSLVDALVAYNLALRKLGMVWLIAFSLLVEFAFIIFFAKSVANVVFMIFFVNLFLLASMLYFTRQHLAFGLKTSEVVVNA